MGNSVAAQAQQTQALQALQARPQSVVGAAPVGADADEARRLNGQGQTLIRQKQLEAAESLLNQAMAICNGALHGEHYCVAGVSQNLADIAEARGDLMGAERLLARAAQVTQAAMGPQDVQLGAIERKLGRMLVLEGKYRQAEPVLKAGMAIGQRAGDIRGVGISADDLAKVYRWTQRDPEAEALLRQLLPICPRVDPTCEATTRTRLGEALWRLNRREEAEAEVRKSADLYAALGSEDSREGALLALSDLFLDAELYPQAEPLLKAQIAAEATSQTVTSLTRAAHEMDLARVYANTNRKALIEPLLKDAQARLAAAPPSSLETGAAETKVAAVLLLLNRTAEAKPLLERAMAIPTPGLALPPWWKVEAESRLGDIAYVQLRSAEAEVLYRKAADDYENASSLGRSRYWRDSQAAAILDQHRLDEGEAILKTLLPQMKATRPEDPRGVAMVEANLARVANERLDFKTAEGLAAEALAEQQKLAAPPGPDQQMSGILYALGVAEKGLGKFAAAETHMRASLDLTAVSEENPGYVVSERHQLCQILAFEGKFAEEAACARDQVAQVDRWTGATPAVRVGALMIQGNSLIDQSRYVEARDVFLKARALHPAGEAPDAQLGGVAMSLGQAYAFSGDPLKAAVALGEARAIFAELGLGDKEEGIEAARRLGDVDITLGHAHEAEPLIRASVAWFEAHIGPEHPRTATQYRSLGQVLATQDRLVEAEAAFNRALAIRKAAPNLGLVAQSLGDLADCEKRLSRFDQARELLRQAEAAEVAAHGKSDWTVGEVARELGELDAEQGHRADAEANYKRALPLLAAAGATQQRQAMTLQNNIGWLDEAEGRYAEARRVFEANLTQEEKVLGPDDVMLIDPLSALAALDRNAGRFDAAVARFERVQEIARKTYGDSSTRLEGAWLDLAGIYSSTGRAAEAEQAVAAALALQRAGPGLDNGSSVLQLARAADIYDDIGKLAEAQAAADQAVAVARAHPGDTGHGLIVALLAEAACDRRSKKFADAEAALAEALAKSRALWGDDSVALVSPLAVAGGVQLDLGRAERAEELFAQAADIAAKQMPPEHTMNAYLTNDLAQAYIAEDRPGKAEAVLKPLLARLTKQGDPAALVAAYAEITLAKAYAAQERPAEAAAAIADARKFLGQAPLKPVFAEPARN
ncbi:tetratricopeptide repeat protein [Phenylobacterium sp.]|uniref:tetratricopeptide repeat protein n=1 Tax=Phenylobacterium sp. TaxID=1871053 RepID=UPI0025E632DD|nr:tetratricopeptide repeat protein [Phenylobacterium sp.]